MFADPLTEKLAAFVRGVGIAVKPAVLDEPTLFPGLDIRYGAVLVDESRLRQPGDILHEAGHIAVTDPAKRMEMGRRARALYDARFSHQIALGQWETILRDA